MNRRDFQNIAQIRLRDAQALLASGSYRGANYLAGYVIECALKACIAKRTKLYDFPDKETVNASYIHSIRKLIEVAGLKTVLDAACRADPALANNFDIVTHWSEQSRYTTYSNTQAEELIEAITDRRHGVLKWIRQHW